MAISEGALIMDNKELNSSRAKYYNIMTLPSRKFALLVSSTGRVGLSISWALLRLISAFSSDFPDLGGLARPGEAREAR